MTEQDKRSLSAFHWNYRIVARGEGDERFYALHEAYYDENGKPTSITDEPIAAVADTIDGVIAVLEMQIKDAMRSKADILEYERFIGKEDK